MLPVTSMMNAVKATPFTSESLLKNPAASQLADLKSFADAIAAQSGDFPSNEFQAIQSLIDSFTTTVEAEMIAKAANLQFEIPLLSAANNIRTTVSQINAALVGPDDVNMTVQPPCFDLTVGLGPLTGTASLISDTLNAITKTVSETLNVAISSFGDLVLEVSSQGLGVLTESIDKIQSTIQDMASSFDQMVVDAAAAISDALEQIKAYNFLGLLTSNDPCIKDVMSTIANQANIDMRVIARL
jgi:hypothetical protein